MRTISRSQAIANLRRELLKLVDEEHSLCLVAARRGLICNGLGRWSTAELVRRLPWRTPSAAPERAEVERLANDWLSAFQDRPSGRLPCDPAPGRASLCAGWEEFYEGELARFHREMCGEEVRVVPDALLAPDPA
jgi:hypothetical protein